MHFPFIFHIGSTELSLHGICELVGIFIAFRYYLFLKRRGDILEANTRTMVVIATCIGAFLGARIIGSLENVPEWMAAKNKWAYFNGNKTLVGGMLGGVAGVEIMKACIGEKQSTGDIFVFPLILGMMIGRIGCFSAGIYEETYGFPSSLPWAMNLGDGIPRHPVTLYEIFFLAIMWIVLAFVKRNYVTQQGALFKLLMIAYLTFRFLLDFIKPGWRYAFGLGTIQLACIAGLLYYSKYIFDPRKIIISKRSYAG